MFNIGFINYALGIIGGWDLSDAVYNSQNFSVASQDTSPRTISFKVDGTKVYMVGSGTDIVYQYTLSTAWDVSTASYASKSFSVFAQTGTTPEGMFFQPDGTKMYVSGGQNFYQYTLSTAWDVSTASYASKSFSAGSEDGSMKGISIKSDGITMHLSASGSIYQYTLSTAWDISSTSYDSKSFSVASEESSMRDLVTKPDGSRYFIIGNGNKTFYEYDMSTGWDITTSSYTSVSFSVNAQDTLPLGCAIDDAGNNLFMCGFSGDVVYQYNL